MPAPRHLPLLPLLALAGLLPLGPSCQAPAWPEPEAASASTGRVDQDHQAKAAAAFLALLEAPQDEERIIWYGRRLGYLGRYEDAIEVYGRGLELNPDSAPLLRHRGHRWLSLRRFERAVEDLARAAELIRDQPDVVEQDGLPNARNQPTSSLHTNVWYHLGLARFCRAEFDAATAAFGACLAASRNPDMESAARYWLYLSTLRSSAPERAPAVLAPVDPAWDILENHAYHQLLLLYRGDFDALPGEPGADPIQDATRGFGLANHRLQTGDRAGALELLRGLAERGSPAFGCIAAEAELRRLEAERAP